jgi:hypothetical protein
MTDTNKSGDDKERRENLFQIMDGIINQLNVTKKIFIIMIISIMIVTPLSIAVTFVLFDPPFHFGPGSPPERFGPGPNPFFGITKYLPMMVALVWLGIGIRQWFVLSEWTKKYERYKELQKKIDEKLDYDNDNDKSNEGQQK